MTLLKNIFNTHSIDKLSLGDKILLNDLLIISKIKKGGGYSIRPDLGEINGMVQRTGYLDNNPPVYIGKLLSYVSSLI